MTVEMQAVQRDLGKMEAQIHDIKTDISELNKSVRLLITFMNQAEGGKKLLFGIMTLSAGLGSALTYFVKGWVWP